MTIENLGGNKNENNSEVIAMFSNTIESYESAKSKYEDYLNTIKGLLAKRDEQIETLKSLLKESLKGDNAGDTEETKNLLIKMETEYSVDHYLDEISEANQKIKECNDGIDSCLSRIKELSA